MILEMMVRYGVIIVFIILMVFVALARLSQSTPRLGLQQGKLRPCPSTPNCVCSENDPQWMIKYTRDDHEHVWQLFTEAVIHMGGRVEEDHIDYLHAEFVSRVFGFVDDLEARQDEGNKVIHLRSASRMGYSDMGVNQKRLAQLIATTQSKLASE